MSHRLDIQLLGTPIVMKDGRDVFFSYNKVNALLYYLAVRGRATRDELGGILWPDKDEAAAKKNLRNAMYEMKKILGQDIFAPGGKAFVMLNDEADVHVDVRAFLANPLAQVDLYRGDFLSGFYIKGADVYEEWCMKERHHLQHVYIDTVTEAFRDAAARGDYLSAERYGRIAVQYNPYEEETYRRLLEVYGEQNKTHHAVKLYRDLEVQLNDAFEAEPETETKELMQRILRRGETAHGESKPVRRGGRETVHSHAKPGDMSNEADASEMQAHAGDALSFAVVEGRESDLEALAPTIRSFARGEGVSAVFLTGEAGSGKTQMKGAVLDALRRDEHLLVVDVKCYAAEQAFLLRSWIPVIEALLEAAERYGDDLSDSDLRELYRFVPEIAESDGREAALTELASLVKFDALYHRLLALLGRIAAHGPVILAFDDIEYMDPLSLSLLSTLVLRGGAHGFRCILTGLESGSSDLRHFVVEASEAERLRVVRLQPLPEADIVRMAHARAVEVGDDMAARIRRETGGNLFLVTECLRALKDIGHIDDITPDAERIFERRYEGLSEDGRRIMDLAALFADGAPEVMLRVCLDKGYLTVAETIDELLRRNFLLPVDEYIEPVYAVAQQQMKAFLLRRQSDVRLKSLHAYFGELWEHRLTHTDRDRAVYRHLLHHFTGAEQWNKVLYYKLKNLTDYLDFSHELFPVLGAARDGELTAVYFSEVDTLSYIGEVDALMYKVRRLYGATPEVRQMQLDYLYLKGRYFIREGAYDKGYECIRELIDEAVDTGSDEYALKGYKQLIYGYIQTEDARGMAPCIDEALRIATDKNYKKEIGVLLRLKGLNRLMRGEFEEAETLLTASEAHFTSTAGIEKKYGLHIAAARNYIGEIRYATGDYDAALRRYAEALALATDEGAYGARTVFQCNAGLASFAAERYEEAEAHFRSACDEFAKYDFMWRRPIVEALLAVLAAKRGAYAEAARLVRIAERTVLCMNNPREIGTLYCAKAILKRCFAGTAAASQLNESAKSYARSALYYLPALRDAALRREAERMLQGEEEDIR